MATRRPLVNVSGVISELPTGDTVAGAGSGDVGKRYSGQWYGPNWWPSLNNTYTTCALNGGYADTVMLQDFDFATPTPIDRIGIEITTAGAAGSVLRFGVFLDNSATILGSRSRAIDAGTVTAAATGLVYVPASLTLVGRFWVGVVGQQTPTGLIVRGGPNGGYKASRVGGSPDQAMNAHQFGALKFAAVGAFPAETGTLQIDTGQGPAGVMVRIA